MTLLFYAGHGLQVQGKNWLVPVDAKLRRKLDLNRGAVELDTVMEHMRGTKKLVFLDACRNNPLAGDMARSMGVSRTVATSRGLARVQSGQGTLIGYATAPDDVAADGEGRNSPFTAALLAHIERPGLSVHDMFAEVATSVREATNGDQQPWLNSSLGLFHLASGATPPPPSDDTGTVGGTPPPPPGAAARAYEAAERVGTVAAFRVVVESFPSSVYAQLAQTQITQLEGKGDPIVVAGGDPGEDEVVAPTDPSPKDAAKAAYEEAKALGDVAAFRVVVEDFPGSPYAKLARVQIAKLEVPTPEKEERGLGLGREAKRLVQMGLASAGHDPGRPDGVFGGRTQRALRAWQESKELEVTGYLTKEQSEVLVAMGREEVERRRVQAEREAREAAARRRAEAERKAREEKERRKRALKPGKTFRDCPECPEMVVVPAGSFLMGASAPRSLPWWWDKDRIAEAIPTQEVTIGYPLAVGMYEVTRWEFARFVSATERSMRDDSCDLYVEPSSRRNWKSPGFSQTDAHPVVCVSWLDAKAYVEWLSRKTDEEYRLLSESEWEYVARAGTATMRYWGDGEEGQCRHANGADREAERRQINAVTVRIPVKVITDSGGNVISDSGESDHWSERSDAGVGL